MKYIITFILTCCILALLYTFRDPIYDRLLDSNSYKTTIERLEIQEKQHQLESAQKEKEATLPLKIAQSYIYSTLAVIALLAVIQLAYLAAKKKIIQEPLIYTDSNGNYPVPRYQLTQGDLTPLIAQIAQQVILTKQLHEIHQPGQVPLHYTHNPSVTHNPAIHYANSIQSTGNNGETTLQSQFDGSIPPFSDLLKNGTIGPNKPILFGINDNHEFVTGDWPDMCAILIGGKSNSGKSTTTTLLAAQAVMQGAQIMICDPHGHANARFKDQTLIDKLAPLSFAYACEPAINDTDIVKVANFFLAELKLRKQGKGGDLPYMLFIDEFTSLMLHETDVSKKIALILEEIANEGRKFLMSVALLAHSVHVDRMGGGTVKNALASSIIHRFETSEAALIIPEISKKNGYNTDLLQPGEAYVKTNKGLSHIYVPQTTKHDLETLFSQQSQHTTAAPTLDIDSQEIITSFKSGMTIGEIVKKKYGVSNGGKYTELVGVVQETIRTHYTARD